VKQVLTPPASSERTKLSAPVIGFTIESRLPFVNFYWQAIGVREESKPFLRCLVNPNRFDFDAASSQLFGSILYVVYLEGKMTQTASLRTRSAHRRIRKRKDFDLVILSNLQIELERFSFLSVDFFDNLQT